MWVSSFQSLTEGPLYFEDDDRFAGVAFLTCQVSYFAFRVETNIAYSIEMTFSLGLEENVF